MVEDDPVFTLTFHDVDNTLGLNAEALEQWLVSCLLEENATLKSYSVVFCNDSYLLDLNQQYLNHDEWTDIITFDYGTMDNAIRGEAFISIDRILENAMLFEIPPRQEALRVIAHGLLHLLGYRDKEEKDRKLMRSKEEHFMEQHS